MSPDGSQFATAGQDNSAKVWDFPTNKHQREFAVSDESRAVAVSPDNTKLACGSKDGKLRVYNVADGKQVYEIAAHTSRTGIPTYRSSFAQSTTLLVTSTPPQSSSSTTDTLYGTTSSVAWCTE